MIIVNFNNFSFNYCSQRLYLRPLVKLQLFYSEFSVSVASIPSISACFLEESSFEVNLNSFKYGTEKCIWT